MIRYLRAVGRWFSGEGLCPSCDGPLVAMEADYHVCAECGAIVDFERGGWSYAGESKLRRLPGLSGMSFDRRQSA